MLTGALRLLRRELHDELLLLDLSLVLHGF